MVRRRAPDLRTAGSDLNRPRRVFVIFNPASGRGRGARRIDTYRRLLEERLPGVEFGFTEGPGHERDLAEEAVAAGFDVVAAAGGDGTWSNVADRVVACGHGRVAFAMLPNGTGNDFGRNLGFRPADPEHAVDALVRGHTVRVDVGHLESPSWSEHDPTRVEPR
ncbi:MAG: acylglycerol kinase family protein, partial [Longimicrobiales bacterium]